MKVADQIAEFLARKGIKHVFAIVGAGNAQIFDAITRLGKTEIVCVHHEQAAAMAMQTYYRTCGTVSAAIVTTGGGSTNAFTGVVGAWADSIPGLVISGNENSRFTTRENPLRMWGVQGYDSSAAVEGVTKRAVRVSDATEVVAELERCYALCTDGRPGPCWVDVPMNLQSAAAPAALPAEAGAREPEPAAAESVAAVADLLRSAERPLLWLGHGIRLAGAVELIEPLLATTGAPALVSWAGVDMVASEHPQVIGRAGVYGQRAANLALQTCDALVCIGTRLAIPQIGYDLDELARGARMAVVDVDPAEAHKLEPRVELPVVADAGEFIRALVAELGERPAPSFDAWTRRCRELRVRYPWIGPEHADADGYPNSYRLLDRLSDELAHDEVVVTDMGTALLSGHAVMRFRKGQRLMTSTGLGEMGFGLPAAIGASFARDRGRVLCLNCDGGMMMNLQELQTIAHHRLPIRIVVFNNDGYLMIKHTQKALFEGRYAGTHPSSGMSCPDFSAVASAFGMPSFQIRDWTDYDAVVPEFMTADGPAICEVFTHPEQFFHPKLSVATQSDGSLLSPPLEDLSPFLPRDELAEAMEHVGLHEKSQRIEVS